MSVPVFGDIGERFAEREFLRYTGTVMDEPGLHVGGQRRRPFLPSGKAKLRITARIQSSCLLLFRSSMSVDVPSHSMMALSASRTGVARV